MQTRRQIIIEANINTWIGLLGSWLITWLVLENLHLSSFWLSNITVALCTIWSLIRNYFIRNYFNRKYTDEPESAADS